MLRSLGAADSTTCRRDICPLDSTAREPPVARSRGVAPKQTLYNEQSGGHAAGRRPDFSEGACARLMAGAQLGSAPLIDEAGVSSTHEPPSSTDVDRLSGPSAEIISAHQRCPASRARLVHGDAALRGRPQATLARIYAQGDS